MREIDMKGMKACQTGIFGHFELSLKIQDGHPKIDA